MHFALTGDTKTCFGNPRDCYKLNGGIGLLMCASVKPGLLAHVEGLNDLKTHKDVVYCRQIIPEGELIPDSGDVRQRVAAVGAYIKHESEVPLFIKDFYGTYKIYDKNGNDMIISKFNY